MPMRFQKSLNKFYLENKLSDLFFLLRSFLLAPRRIICIYILYLPVWKETPSLTCVWSFIEIRNSPIVSPLVVFIYLPFLSDLDTIGGVGIYTGDFVFNNGGVHWEFYWCSVDNSYNVTTSWCLDDGQEWTF